MPARNMHAHPTRRSSFLDRVLDGRAEPSSFTEELAAARADARGRDIAGLMGLTEDELAQAEACLPALRYILHARRFQLPEPRGLMSIEAVRAHALQLAAAECDPYELADIDDWAARRIASPGDTREASHG